LGFRKGVEIGVDKGWFSETLCLRNPACSISGVDLWDVAANYAEAQKILQAFPLYTMIKKSSMEAVRDFEDGSLDFVYIDGNHLFDFVREDVREWSKKVRVGGIVSGHDYTRLNSQHFILEVKPAINEYVALHKIRPWFTLGRLRSSESIGRNRTRSWFWVKQEGY
jgi:hypothetical protein